MSQLSRIKDLIYIVTIVIALTVFGYKVSAVSELNAAAVTTLKVVVENLDSRVSSLEKDKLEREAFQKGFDEAMKESGGRQ